MGLELGPSQSTEEKCMPQFIVVVSVNPKHTFATAIKNHGTDYLRDYLASKLPAGSPVKVQSVVPVTELIEGVIEGTRGALLSKLPSESSFG